MWFISFTCGFLHNGRMKSILLAIALVLPYSAHAADFTNFLGMDFKNLPSGQFVMGSCKPQVQKKCLAGKDAGPVAAYNEAPQHKVRVSKPFQIGVYEVTVRQFRRFIAKSWQDNLARPAFNRDNAFGDDAPVSHVSWRDAQLFIDWLNKAKPETDKGVYRLPTEAEWEYAARAGTASAYSFGDDVSNLGDYAWFFKNAHDKLEKYPHPVGTKKPNPWGLYDMHGNVYEWVSDWYGENDYRRSPVVDPAGPESGRFRVYRGGSWSANERFCRSAARLYDYPQTRKAYIGFRVVRKLP